MSNQLHTELSCKVSYWKIYKGMEYAKSNVRGTHEHGYAVFNAYRYMLEVSNPRSKTTLSLDENRRFKYFFVSYAAWITGFQEMRKVIAIDGTFLRSKYEGVLLSAVAQDAENHIFPVAFCVVDKERFALLFHQRRMQLVNSTNRFVPSIEKDISKYVNAGNKLLAHQIANYKFSVTGHGDVATVDLQRRTCTCRIFDLDKVPCPHAMAALRAQYVPGSSIKSLMNLLYIKRVSGNLEALYRKGVYDFFNRSDSNGLGMLSQAADCGHIGASYVLAIVSIFNGGEFMKEGGMWMPAPNLLGGRPICCTVHKFERIGRRNGWPMESDNEDDIHCDL
ncbi:hypothetical protein KY290_021160 [Solanum tuberosum]|uniref:SWIM-type domain-containing protein n=1 Tax=Solanum tuberosum TaxID=4113 RepID=A0ABQ7V0R5_SOLTU|nr:hypothetical protein KY289_022389 [Solanum tuberosum]KAH0692996.1 hypothetical protein KY285_020093 [Solanum tuberosum]KAH0757667.1 hypothetical protein KY290_021160 [Solanum tuberosum]